MTLLDRFRTQPRQKHPDPAVRLAYVEELPLADREHHRRDGARRRRPAGAPRRGRQADGPGGAGADCPATIATRRFGRAPRSMLRDIALEAFEDVGEAASLEAVDVIADPRTLAQIAKSSTREAVALRALSALDDGRLLGSVARHAVLESVRRAALQSLVARGDHGGDPGGRAEQRLQGHRGRCGRDDPATARRSSRSSPGARTRARSSARGHS